jgi:hypothetical protein
MPPRIECDMKTGHDDDRTVLMETIVDALREALKDMTTRLAVDDRARSRERSDRLDGHVDDVSELIAQARTLLLVPALGRRQVVESLP